MPALSDYVFCDELPNERQAVAFDATSSSGSRTYTRSWLIQMSRRGFDPQMACLCPGLPLPFSSYITDGGGYDLNALLVKYTSKVKPDTDADWFIVTADYTTDRSKADPKNFNFPTDRNGNPTPGAHNNPEMELPELEWDYEETSVQLFKDLKGKPFLNSAWQPIQGGATIPVHRPILILTRNELNYSPKRASLFAGSVNDSPFLDYPVDSVLCMAPKVKCVFDKGPAYWRVTYRIKFGYQLITYDKDGAIEDIEYESFQHSELDQGYAERKMIGNAVIAVVGGVSSVTQKYTNVPIIPHGTNLHRPTMLDGNGLRQTKMVVDESNNPLYPKPVWLDFMTRRRRNFTQLFQYGLTGNYPPKPKP